MNSNLNDTELWQYVDGFDEQYMVSNFGRVLNVKSNAVLKQSTNYKGYKVVSLLKDGKPKQKRVHRIVAKTFIGETDKKDANQINHKDGNKSNNHIYNLEWCTPKENINHAIQTGLWNYEKGENKLNEEKVKEIRRLHSEGMSYEKIAQKFNINKSTARRAGNGTTWAWVNYENEERTWKMKQKETEVK